ncbi:DNA lyase [Candidatus Pacearchaeota archaeon]|nr:MAG: DNA lyase [Candidatus Pacearchaeota archaeon]
MSEREHYKRFENVIKQRLEEFSSLDWEARFKEFVFCLLTPQSNAKRCWEAVELIFAHEQFPNLSIEELERILSTRTRFHRTKARNVLRAIKKWDKIKERIELSEAKLKDQGARRSEEVVELRDWLASNVKGMGMKEASHFLRNIGLSRNSIAILDRHILRNLLARKVVSSDRIKSAKHYKEIEEEFLEFSSQLGFLPDELDLVYWSKETGEVFK